MRSALRTVGASAIATVAMLALAALPAHADPTSETTTGHRVDAGVPVAAASGTVVDEVLPTGSIGGTLSAGSEPVAGIGVVAEPVDGQETFGQARIDDAGRFEMSGLVPGRYLLFFDIGDGGRQWYPGQLEPSAATPVAVLAGQRTEITETLLPTGSAAGRLVEDGAPVEGASVTWSMDELQFFVTTTDADGRYALPRVFAGTYRVRFILPDARIQYAHGKLDETTADQFTVTAGALTTVDETVLPTGQVEVRAVDALTGAPVSGFCAQIVLTTACTDGEVATLAKVPVGTHTVQVFPFSDEYLIDGTATVQVTAGAVAAVTVRITPSAIITTTVRDRRTGTPIEGVCVNAVTLRLAALSDGQARCSDDQGQVRLGGLAAGTYTLFAAAHDGVHGAQWVGPTGGTGNQFDARVLTVQAGQTVNLPPIRMDPAGSIAGRITDKATGAPLQDAIVSLLTFHPGAGPTGPHAFTDADGRYTLTELGPYNWPVHFTRFGYAAQWSGGVPSRLVATPVKVKAGRTATSDAALGTGTTLRGAVTVDGDPVPPFQFIAAYEALTGDIVGATVTTAAGYELRVLGPTAIRINIHVGVPGFRWYADAPDFGHATIVLVPSSGTKELDLAFG